MKVLSIIYTKKKKLFCSLFYTHSVHEFFFCFNVKKKYSAAIFSNHTKSEWLYKIKMKNIKKMLAALVAHFIFPFLLNKLLSTELKPLSKDIFSHIVHNLHYFETVRHTLGDCMLLQFFANSI